MNKTIHVLRRRGGLGDMIRIFPVFDGLRHEFPESTIAMHGPEEYRDLFHHRHCWGLEACPYRDARPLVFDNSPGPGRYEDDNEIIIDLDCPARAHEMETHGNPTKERTAIFCATAGVPVRTPKMDVEYSHMLAGCWGDVIGMHPRSAALIRNWPKENWRRLADMVRGAGYCPTFFDSLPDYCADLPGMHYTGLALHALAMVMSVRRSSSASIPASFTWPRHWGGRRWACLGRLMAS